MNLYLDLIICSVGLALWVFVLVFFSVRISRAKKKLTLNQKQIPKPENSYYFSLVLSGFLSVLPFLVLFSVWISAVFELCAVLGAYIVLKDRMQTVCKG